MALLQKWWRHKYKKMQNLKNVTFFVISVYLCSKDKNVYFIPHRTWCNECYNSAGVTEAFRQSRAKQMRHFAKKWNLQKNPPPPKAMLPKQSKKCVAGIVNSLVTYISTLLWGGGGQIHFFLPLFLINCVFF